MGLNYIKIFFYFSSKMLTKELIKNDKLEQISREELEYVEAKSLPLRNYLMTHVMPTLTKGLIQCGKIKPEDPIDFLVSSKFIKFSYFLIAAHIF